MTLFISPAKPKVVPHFVKMSLPYILDSYGSCTLFLDGLQIDEVKGKNDKGSRAKAKKIDALKAKSLHLLPVSIKPSLRIRKKNFTRGT